MMMLATPGLAVLLSAGLLLAAAAATDGNAQPGDRTFDCLMEPRAVVKIGAQVTGLIRDVLVDRGDAVRQGQILVQLHSEVQEAIVGYARLKASNEFQIRAQQSRRDFLRKRVERIEALRRKDVASTASLEEVTSELKVIESAEQEARLTQELARMEHQREAETLAQRQIRSPVNGIVTERTMSAGEYRHENNHLLTVAQIDPLNIETYLPMADWGRVKLGTNAIVMPEAPVGGRYDAKVIVIDRIADAASGTFGVRLALANPGNALPAGIRCRVTFPN